MSKANRPNRKASDADIIRLNSVGLSLATIARTLQIHPTSVTNRLHNLGVPPADTRRAFMEDIVIKLTDEQQTWLVNQVGPAFSIKDFVKKLIVEAHIREKSPNVTGNP